MSLGNMLVLTWWIGPHSYGIYVTAIGLAGFFASLARAGVDTYLVRSELQPSQRQWEIANTLVLSISVALSAFALACLPLLGRWYGNHEFAAAYLVLLFTIPITGLTGIPMAKLDRDLDFRRAATIELAGQSIGLVVSALMAFCRAGVWAAVGGLLVGQLFVLIATSVSARLHLWGRLRFDWDEIRAMLSFGAGFVGAQRIWQVRSLVNPLLMGRFVGPEGVAFVGLAIRIAEALGSVRLAGSRLAIAALSRLQAESTSFVKALQQAVFLQVVILGPLLCMFAICGPWVVVHILGVRWKASLVVYPFIAAGVLMNSIYNLQASALFVRGEPWVVLRSYVLHVVALTAATALLNARLGIAAYGWAELVACFAYLPIQRAISRTLALKQQQLFPWVAIFLFLLFLPILQPKLAASLKESGTKIRSMIPAR